MEESKDRGAGRPPPAVLVPSRRGSASAVWEARMNVIAKRRPTAEIQVS